MGRAPCCDKNKVKRGPWSPEEDSTLKDYVLKHGTGGNWIALPKKAGLKRCGKSCRLRWLNYLRPDIKHGGFTEEEDNLIISIYSNIGSRWSVIASQLPGRTDNDIKNYWNTKLKKRLLSAAKATTSIYTQNPPDFPTILTPPDTHIATSSAAAPLPPMQDVPGEFYGILPTQPNVQATNTTILTYPNVHGMPEIFVPEIPYEFNHYQDLPLPRLMEFQDNATANYDGFYKDSLSQETLCRLSSNSYGVFDSMTSANYGSWSDDNGVAEEAGFLMEMGPKLSYDLLHEFDLRIHQDYLGYDHK